MAARLTLAEQVERAKAESGGRGYAVVYSGPAASAAVKGSLDGDYGRPSRAHTYRTLPEREAYEYCWRRDWREPRDRDGNAYAEPLF